MYNLSFEFNDADTEEGLALDDMVEGLAIDFELPLFIALLEGALEVDGLLRSGATK